MGIYYVEEVQNFNSSRQMTKIEARNLFAAKNKATRNQGFEASTLKIYGENKILKCSKEHMGRWDDKPTWAEYQRVYRNRNRSCKEKRKGGGGVILIDIGILSAFLTRKIGHKIFISLYVGDRHFIGIGNGTDTYKNINLSSISNFNNRAALFNHILWEVEHAI